MGDCSSAACVRRPGGPGPCKVSDGLSQPCSCPFWGLSRAAFGLNQLQELEDGLAPLLQRWPQLGHAAPAPFPAPGIFVRKSISALGCIPKNKGDSAGIVS